MSKIDLAFLPQTGVIAVVGAQWGDEGKGKIVDWLGEWAHVIARGTGGANAGHTIVYDGVSHIFHLVPSGILRDCEGVINIIGRGVAFDPVIMLAELAELEKLGVSYKNLRISKDAHIVLPQHTILDRVREANAGGGKIGTTGRGIGPCYSDHVGRIGLRVVDMLNPDSFRQKLERNLKAHQLELATCSTLVTEVMSKDRHLYQFYTEENSLSVDAIIDGYVKLGARLRPMIADTDAILQQAVADGKRVLLEGAQASLLSIDHGLYPMVTSSDSTIAGLASGVGLLGSQVHRVYGIVKAPAMTRVGSGVFPTELGPAEDASYEDADINSGNPGEQCVAIRKIGHEYGATTGRPRRIGWLDLPLLRLALRSGGDDLVLTKLDMMDGCRIIEICTEYEYQGPDYDLGDCILHDGDRVKVAFGDDALMQRMKPIYECFPGWMMDTTKARDAEDLPEKLMTIIRFIEKEADRKVAIVSVGPDREQTIVL